MAKTLTQLRKEITLDTAMEVKTIARLFGRIAKQDPDAVKAAFSLMLQDQPEAKQDWMVQFYLDQAEYLINLFTLD